jgi:hypothetical protein
MLTPEARLPEKGIHEALINDAQRPKLVETLPDWMNRDAHVRFGNHDIELDATRLPRIEGVMGAVNLLRKGQAEFKQEAFSPAKTPANKEQSGALLAVKAILEMAGLAAGGEAIRRGRGGKNALLFLGGLGLAAGSGIGLTMDLSGCSPAIVTEVPPGSPTALPATEMPVQVTLTPLSNEVVNGTPSAAPETPAPIVGASYPTEISTLESPLVYSYGGETGRQNMNEYTRQLFDRYIAEMGPLRGGFLTGTTVDELYRSFDQNYDFKLFTTDAGLTWLVQSKSDGSFLVPKDQNGQIFRDLQLPYDYLFEVGQAVGVGNDNFDLQRFQANKVGFVGAWPVLVTVDGQNVPVSWMNMEQGGAATPIVMASTAEAPTPQEPTAVPDSRVALTVGAETFRVTTDVLYSEAVTNVNIDPTKAQKIGEVLVHTDASGRLLWNEHMQAWVPEFGTSMDYKSPETAPVVPFEAYYDGSKPGDAEYVPSSAALSDMLYVAEHPNLIASDASYPYYRVTLFGNDKARIGYEIGLTGPNQYLLNENKTDTSRTLNRPFAYFGVQQTQDASGDVIYIIKKANWNPDGEIKIITTNHGFDQAAYNEWFQYPLILKYLTNTPSMTGELVPLFLSPDGQFQETNPNLFYYETDPANPNVASLVSADAITMFSPGDQADILSLYPQINKPFDATTNPGSYLIDSLPPEMSNMILVTGVHQFHH